MPKNKNNKNIEAKADTPFWKSPTFWEAVISTVVAGFLAGLAEGIKSYFRNKGK